MAELLEESQGLESTTIGIYRTAATVKGGRRFSFSALVVVGDRNGSVGMGYGKAPGVPAAIEKAQKEARKRMVKLVLQEGTLPHAIESRFGASKVKLIPASPGTGVIAGATARAVLEMAGVRDCLTKSLGSNNQKNLAKATMAGLTRLVDKDLVGALRGVELEDTEVDEKLEAGRRYAPTSTVAPEGPPRQEQKREERGGGRGRGGRGGRGRGGGGGGGGRGRGGGGGGGYRGGGGVKQQRSAPVEAPPVADPPAADSPAPGADSAPPAADTKPESAGE